MTVVQCPETERLDRAYTALIELLQTETITGSEFLVMADCLENSHKEVVG